VTDLPAGGWRHALKILCFKEGWLKAGEACPFLKQSQGEDYPHHSHFPVLIIRLIRRLIMSRLIKLRWSMKNTPLR
jgi:hypothetical protein